MAEILGDLNERDPNSMLKAIATSSSENSKLDISVLAGQQRSVFDVKREVSISSGDSNPLRNTDNRIQNEIPTEDCHLEVSKRNLCAYEVTHDQTQGDGGMLIELQNPKDVVGKNFVGRSE